MSNKVKMVYFVTLVIKITERKKIAGSNLEHTRQRITVYQKIQKKSKDSTDAYNQTMIEAQSKYGAVGLVAHTTTELTEEIFEEDMDIQNGKVIKMANTEQVKTGHATQSNDMEGQES